MVFFFDVSKMFCIHVCEAREKTSQYKSVYWNHQNAIWHVKLSLGGRKQKHGGCFKREVDAAKRVNQLCEKFGIPLQNPAISATLNQKFEVPEKCFFYIVQKLKL